MSDRAGCLLQKAKRYEWLMQMTDDARALHALRDLARTYRRRADDLTHRRVSQATHQLGLNPGRRSNAA